METNNAFFMDLYNMDEGGISTDDLNDSTKLLMCDEVAPCTFNISL